MTSFCQILNQDLEQGKLMAAVILGNKGPNVYTTGSNVQIDWMLARYLGKTFCVGKCKKKMDIENFIIVAL